MPRNIVRARYLLSSPGSEALRRDVAIEYAPEGIRSVAPDPGSPDETLVLPPLSNGHDHGRGLKPIAYGAPDHAVEAWVPATYTLPPVEPYLVAAAAFGRMAQAGIGSVVHCHLSRDPATLLREAKDASRAAREVGLRVEFVVPLRDRHRLGYAADEDILGCLDAVDAEAVRSRFLRPIPPVEQQLAVVEEIAAVCESELFRVQLGPVGVEWCSDGLLEKIAGISEARKRRVHMHLLESTYQRQWADRAYPQGIVRHLETIGLLTPRLTVAHGTWLRPDECAALAGRGVTVSVNTSSNLRLRSGVAPVRQMHAAGLGFALGLDALALDDDEDLFREMRLAYLLHRGIGFDQKLARQDLLGAATNHRQVAVGGPADLLVLGLERITRDLGPGLYELPEVLHARALASDVRSLIVAGREIVADGRVRGIDLGSVERELGAQLRKHAEGMAQFRPLLLRYQAALERFYLGGGHLKGHT